jgi:hypothetical protein
MPYSDDEYEIPLEDQRVFGAGIKRKRVAFVPSTQAAFDAAKTGGVPSAGQSVSDIYLSIVQPRSVSAPPNKARKRRILQVRRKNILKMPVRMTLHRSVRYAALL